jgi:hypothetical protein
LNIAAVAKGNKEHRRENDQGKKPEKHGPPHGYTILLIAWIGNNTILR